MISVSRDGQHIGDYTSVFLCYQGLQTTDYDNLPTRDNLYGAIRRHYEQHSQFSYRNFDFNVTNDKEALWT